MSESTTDLVGTAIQTLAKRITNSTDADQAPKFTQAALHLSQVQVNLAQAAAVKEGKGKA